MLKVGIYSTPFALKPLDKLQSNYILNLTQIYRSSCGHMTKMAAKHINGKNFLQNRMVDITETLYTAAGTQGLFRMLK